MSLSRKLFQSHLFLHKRIFLFGMSLVIITGLSFMAEPGLAQSSTSLFQPVKVYAPNWYAYQLPNNQTFNYSLLETDSYTNLFYNVIQTNQSFSYFLPNSFQAGNITFQSKIHSQKQLRSVQGNFLLDTVENRSLKITYANKSLVIHEALFHFIYQKQNLKNMINNLLAGVDSQITISLVYNYKDLLTIGADFTITYFASLQTNQTTLTNQSSQIVTNLKILEQIKAIQSVIAINTNQSVYTTPNLFIKGGLYNTSLDYIILQTYNLPTTIHLQTDSGKVPLQLYNMSWQSNFNQQTNHIVTFNSSTITFSTPSFEFTNLLFFIPLLIYYTKNKHKRGL